MQNLGWGEILIIAMVFAMLFGAKKLPDTARAVGRSLRIFKAETSKLHDDDPPVPTQPPTPAPTPALSLEEQARQLEEQAARLRASIRREPGGSAGPA
ncbi:Twin-arginine translocation protein TatA [[Actinomadura] parvosata subsp. kistnae]|uniref:Sec-independent protein translocase protein TatA n=1 Tax=[Actinomadura] parvosata subsp. kistnae TaxID=1909395 RepID=A0A1V0A1C8_9ACTN|nr:twin-arginine translocase TatA/TatE family subunit [Nonomuraea sp. ATCC 55076]AQZ63962.1 Sec-independent protein translocase TatA [Nonomuraea sp. ATCC 55076]SPL89828.1 Twin-arginine translocation protein TatA [Actinomadura parvosata subsp. kistnae]